MRTQRTVHAVAGPPDLVVVGHVTRDLAPDGPKLGGAAAYASLVGARLGVRTALVTAAGPDLDLADALPGVDLNLVPSARTTVMEHIYSSGRRTQYLRQRAKPLDQKSIPERLSAAHLLLLGPVASEVDPAVVRTFPNALIAAAAQGWLRRIVAGGLIEDGHLDDLDLSVLSDGVTVLVLSKEDLGGKSLPQSWLDAFPILILSNGSEGLSLHHSGQWWSMPAFPAVERDATGAGDTLSVAFLLRYGETGDISESARFAAATASFVVEARGTDGAPSRAKVEQRLRDHPEVKLVRQ